MSDDHLKVLIEKRIQPRTNPGLCSRCNCTCQGPRHVCYSCYQFYRELADDEYRAQRRLRQFKKRMIKVQNKTKIIMQVTGLIDNVIYNVLQQYCFGHRTILEESLKDAVVAVADDSILQDEHTR